MKAEYCLPIFLYSEINGFVEGISICPCRNQPFEVFLCLSIPINFKYNFRVVLFAQLLNEGSEFISLNEYDSLSLHFPLGTNMILILWKTVAQKLQLVK